MLLILPLALSIRMAVWWLLPHTWYASDEESYFRAGQTLFQTGSHDLFWPPVVPWMVAALQAVGLPSIAHARLFWALLDTCNVALLYWVTLRIASQEGVRARLAAALASGFYAVYVPAVGFASFVTSETPTVLLLLLTLALLTTQPTSEAEAPKGSHWSACFGKPFVMAQALGAGVLIGLTILTRSNLLPLAFAIPLASWFGQFRRRKPGGPIHGPPALMALAATTFVAAYAGANWLNHGTPVLSRNAAYNLYIGNARIYQEDLNLFRPAATLEQIEARRDRSLLTPPNLSDAEMRRLGLEALQGDPVLFARRALGRLARVMAPKTTPLEVLGGERQTSIRSPRALALLAASNLQYLALLVAGIAGLFTLRSRSPRATSWAVVLGSLPLCLVAISKPRYSFPFEPVLIAAAAIFVITWKDRLQLLRRHGLAFSAVIVFVAWSWAAWTIFAVTSRF